MVKRHITFFIKIRFDHHKGMKNPAKMLLLAGIFKDYWLSTFMKSLSPCRLWRLQVPGLLRPLRRSLPASYP